MYRGIFDSGSLIQPTFLSLVKFGGSGNGTTDNVTPITRAVAELTAMGGGTLILPRGRVYCSSMVSLGYNSGVSINFLGAGGIDQTSQGGATVLYGPHGDDAVLNMQGAVGCSLSNMVISGGTGTTHPKTGLILGRANGGGSAGWHAFGNLGVLGKFDVSGIYNVASEGNEWNNCFTNVTGGNAAKAIYLSSSDAGGLNPATPLVGSTLLGQTFNNCNFYMGSTTANISPIYIHGSVVTGSLAFYGGYIVQANGHFVTINTGVVDGKDTVGPIIFDGVGGERPGGVGISVSGFNLLAQSSGQALWGLHIRGCQFLMTGGKYILHDSNLILREPFIKSMGIDYTNTSALTYMPCTIGAQRFGSVTPAAGECWNGFIDYGAGVLQESTNTATLAGTWTSTFSTSNGYGPVGYYKDADGYVNLTGAPGNGTTATTVFTLPTGYRPAVNGSWGQLSNSGTTTVTIQTNGVITATGAGVDPVYLSGIRFKPA